MYLKASEQRSGGWGRAFAVGHEDDDRWSAHQSGTVHRDLSRRLDVCQRLRFVGASPEGASEICKGGRVVVKRSWNPCFECLKGINLKVRGRNARGRNA